MSNKPVLEPSLSKPAESPLTLTDKTGTDAHATRPKTSKTYPSEQKVMRGWEKR